MDPVAQTSLTRRLIDIDSTTGREADAGRVIASTLKDLGWRVTEQPVDAGRFNVVASIDDPLVVFSTHFDCVPPFIPSREEHGVLFGRGACDAKGTLVAQIAAAERLRASGERRVGLVFVVGEERGSDGAMRANAIAPASCRYLVNGEPTDNVLGAATRGVYRAKLVAAGRAAHSSLPELGESAIDKLVDALVAMRDVDWPCDPELGETFYTTGLIAGGVAPNVIAPHAEAEVMFRTIGDAAVVRAALEEAAGSLVAIHDILTVPPVHLTTLPGFESKTFSFTTDIPFLEGWGRPLLLGPGSVTVAHTDHEHVRVVDLHHATDLYARIAKYLVSQTG